MYKSELTPVSDIKLNKKITKIFSQFFSVFFSMLYFIASGYKNPFGVQHIIPL